MPKRTNTAKWSETQGRWQINVQKDTVRRSFYSSTPGRNGQREANSKADAWLDDGVQGGQRVSQLWGDFLEDVKASSGTSNYVKIKSVGTSYILPSIGTKKIDAITEGHLQTIINQAYKHGSARKDLPQNCHPLAPGETLSRKTLVGIRAAIRQFMKYCRVRRKATTLNPESLTVPQGARLKGKEVLQPEALATLFAEDTTVFRRKRIIDPYIHAYRFAVTSGLRPGEIIGLRCESVSGMRAQIRRSINIYGEETQGKNENALRTVALPQTAQGAAEAQITMLQSRGIEVSPKSSLFHIQSERAFYTAWKRYCAANGIPPISLYELRHTFVSLAKQLPEGQVKELVGHSRNMDTFGIYGHKLSGDDEKLAKDLDAIIRKVME